MTTWIALLRGVNVGGITIRNADLANVFRALDLSDVRTVLASGNVRFRSDDGEAGRGALKSRIEAALRDRFGYAAWILLVTADELSLAIQNFPFEEAEGRHSYVVFCIDESTVDELLAEASSEDDVTAGPGVVYWSTPKGMTVDGPFGKALTRATYKARTTNRNIRTLRKLLD